MRPFPHMTLDLELQAALKDIVDSCEKEDDDIRRNMMRQWKKNEEFWHGVQFLFWSDKDDGWRSPLELDWSTDAELADEFSGFSDKVVNTFRGHGEAIIAALAGQIPALRYLPDDADDDDDVLAARTRSKIADLVQRHNKAKLIFLRALFFLALHGIVASYRYKESDPKYGTYTEPSFGTEEQQVTNTTCKECDYTTPEEVDSCSQCGGTDLKHKNQTVSVPVLQDQKILPKSRVKVDVFGPLHFKVSVYATKQSECTYFLLYGDIGKDIVCAAHPDLADDIYSEGLSGEDRFARSEYAMARDINRQQVVTVRTCWLRPAAFFRCDRKDLRKRLLTKFPKGAKVMLIGNTPIFAGAEDEDLDSRWEIGQAGLSTFIHSDPILKPLVSIQEMRNDLVNLIIQTIKHGIPAQFADPAVLNFDQYGKFEAAPGNVYQTKPGRPGEPIGNSFFESARAILSAEVSNFLKQVDEDSQFVVGSFPSIYGGPSEGKSRTFSEYAASRQMALQRLSIVWTFLTDWWLRTISGAVDMYVDSMVDDEYFTKFDNGAYIKVWIKQAQLNGKIGGVEPEASETFPVSLAQKKDLILKLMEMNNDFINNALYQPENSRIIQDVLALSEFKLPGEAQRLKQMLELNELLKEGPIDPIQSTVPINPDVDDHKVHVATITAWAVDTLGLDCEKSNPEGYANAMAHMRQHLQALVAATLQPNQTPAGTPPPTDQPEIKGQPQNAAN